MLNLFVPVLHCCCFCFFFPHHHLHESFLSLLAFSTYFCCSASLSTLLLIFPSFFFPWRGKIPTRPRFDFRSILSKERTLTTWMLDSFSQYRWKGDKKQQQPSVFGSLRNKSRFVEPAISRSIILLLPCQRPPFSSQIIIFSLRKVVISWHLQRILAMATTDAKDYVTEIHPTRWRRTPELILIWEFPFRFYKLFILFI